MKFNKNTLATTVISASIVIGTIFTGLFTNPEEANGSIMGLTKVAVFHGITLPNAAIKITEINIRPYLECDENENCEEKYNVKLLVNRYTDDTFENDIDQDTVEIDLPNNNLGLNLDAVYQQLIQVEDERYGGASAITVN